MKSGQQQKQQLQDLEMTKLKSNKVMYVRKCGTCVIIIFCLKYIFINILITGQKRCQ